MAGRDLSKTLHPSRMGGWVEPRPLAPAIVAAMGDAIGRPLTADDLAIIANGVNGVAHVRLITSRAAPERVKPVDLRATLRAIGNAATETEARMRYANADTFTAGAIDALLFRTRGRAAGVRDAARRALQAPVKTKAGRNTDGAQMLAIKAATAAWRVLGGDLTVGASLGSLGPTPALRFVVCYLHAAGWHMVDPGHTAARVRLLIDPARLCIHAAYLTRGS